VDWRENNVPSREEGLGEVGLGVFGKINNNLEEAEGLINCYFYPIVKI